MIWEIEKLKEFGGSENRFKPISYQLSWSSTSL